MIDFKKYNELFKRKDKHIVDFHSSVAKNYKNIKLDNIHSYLLKLGDCYTDTGEDIIDFNSIAFSVGTGNKSLAEEKYERNKRRSVQ